MPIVADSASNTVYDRLVRVFEDAKLRMDDAPLQTQLTWEDPTHQIVTAIAEEDRKLLIRCDVVAATCEIAHDIGLLAPETVTLARPSPCSGFTVLQAPAGQRGKRRTVMRRRACPSRPRSSCCAYR